MRRLCLVSLEHLPNGLSNCGPCIDWHLPFMYLFFWFEDRMSPAAVCVLLISGTGMQDDLKSLAVHPLRRTCTSYMFLSFWRRLEGCLTCLYDVSVSCPHWHQLTLSCNTINLVISSFMILTWLLCASWDTTWGWMTIGLFSFSSWISNRVSDVLKNSLSSVRNKKLLQLKIDSDINDLYCILWCASVLRAAGCVLLYC